MVLQNLRFDCSIKENSRRLNMAPFSLRRMLKAIGRRLLKNGAPPLLTAETLYKDLSIWQAS